MATRLKADAASVRHRHGRCTDQACTQSASAARHAPLRSNAQEYLGLPGECWIPVPLAPPGPQETAFSAGPDRPNWAVSGNRFRTDLWTAARTPGRNSFSEWPFFSEALYYCVSVQSTGSTNFRGSALIGVKSVSLHRETSNAGRAEHWISEIYPTYDWVNDNGRDKIGRVDQGGREEGGAIVAGVLIASASSEPPSFLESARPCRQRRSPFRRCWRAPSAFAWGR
jgi:hypothetical protein